ncbi:hypothetical protein [Rhodovastum atsumiense]|uniref:Uncharacterized protein n=1 Tax=Rhodovastum atsumiense TaxID=504468 RepID=A0A5M6IRP9_9PROT|nr:hypothetical protein F1189_20475 [Rhodovastum atsumiense]
MSGDAPPHHCGNHLEDGPPADLSHAGAVIDKAIEYMVGQNIGSLAIASALLGGALGMLARSLGDEAIIRVLDNAIASVRAGELHHLDGSGRA